MAQRGGFVIGMVVGLLVGLALALGVALYITKAPMPFINKVPQRTAEQDSAEVERNRSWDPNAPLSGGSATNGSTGSAINGSTSGGTAQRAPIAAAASSSAAASSGFGPPVVPPLLPPPPAQRATAQATGAGAEPFIYFVQAGAFSRNEDAEQQRARLALAGQSARITEREQSGRTVFRVRLGPFNGRGEADNLQVRLQDQGIDSQIVRVDRP